MFFKYQVRKKSMKKYLIGLLIFLIAGLYIDVRMMTKDEGRCAGIWKQRMLVVQTIVPFNPERQTLYLGVGNRHYDHEEYTKIYLEPRDSIEEDAVQLGINIHYFGCAPDWERAKERGRISNFNDGEKYINLRPFSAKEFLQVTKRVNTDIMTREYYEEWHGERRLEE